MSMMYDSRLPETAVPVARETLALSDASRGLQGMTPPNVGMTNQDTMSAYSKPGMIAAGQMEEQLALANQQITQDLQTAAPQAAAAARGMVIAQSTELNEAQAKAQQMLFERTANIIDATTGGGALMQYNSLVQNVGEENLRNSIATQQAMRTGNAPELGAYEASTMQYKPM